MAPELARLRQALFGIFRQLALSQSVSHSLSEQRETKQAFSARVRFKAHVVVWKSGRIYLLAHCTPNIVREKTTLMLQICLRCKLDESAKQKQKEKGSQSSVQTIIRLRWWASSAVPELT